MTSFSRFVGKLMICIAEKGHFLTQIPHPMHSVSDMKAIFESGVTSIQSLPVRTTGHDFLHSCLHFFGLHLSVSIIAILIISRYMSQAYRVSPLLTSSSFLGMIRTSLSLWRCRLAYSLNLMMKPQEFQLRSAEFRIAFRLGITDLIRVRNHLEPGVNEHTKWSMKKSYSVLWVCL